MDSKNTKYDDITLMQYADGELDNSARLRLEKDLVNNKGLQNRLAVFALTRDDLINTKVKLPKHIEDLIDEEALVFPESLPIKTEIPTAAALRRIISSIEVVITSLETGKIFVEGKLNSDLLDESCSKK